MNLPIRIAAVCTLLAAPLAVIASTGVLAGHGGQRSVYDSISILKRTATTRGDYRQWAASRALPVGAGLRAKNTPIARYARGAGWTPDTVVTLIYNGNGGQAYAFATPTGMFCVAGVDPPGTTGYGGVGCGSTGDAATSGSAWLRSGIGPNHTNTVVMLVPNGVKLAYVKIGPASRVVLLVHHNVASWTGTTPLTASFETPAGRTVTEPTVSYQPQRGPLPVPRPLPAPLG